MLFEIMKLYFKRHFTVDLFQNTHPTIYVNDLFYIEKQNNKERCYLKR